jgi:hypothetical protein
MRFTLHDNVHGSAGTVHPESRRAVTDVARAPWVKALHQWLGRAPAGAPRAGELALGVGTLRMRVSRHGDALAAFWAAAPDWRVVAATAVLGGISAADDDAAVRALREHSPRLPFGESDYKALASEPRPCVGTLYLDAAWFDNGGVELAATALALAALVGPDGRLSVQGEPPATAASAAPAERAPPPFTFTRERVELVTGMVRKKVAAALEPIEGVHFRVYPPPQFHEPRNLLRGDRLFDQLRDTTWWVRWYDGQLDRLSFGEFLAFVDQAVGVGQALRGPGAPDRLALPVNEAVWKSAGPRREARVRQTLDARRLVRDERIRELFDAVALEAPTATHAGKPA